MFAAAPQKRNAMQLRLQANPEMDASDVARIYKVVRRVPKGRVATYGQIALLADLPGYARHVGRALRELPKGSRLPWHRIVNSRGEIAQRSVRTKHTATSVDAETEQYYRLIDEGVEFNENRRIPLKQFQWQPRS